MIVFNRIVPQRFIHGYLPDYIYSQIVTRVDRHKFDALDAYLKTLGINHSTTDVIKYALNNLDVKEVKNEYYIDFSNVLKVGDFTVSQLMRLIDMGNTEVKGIGLISEIVRYINSHRGSMIERYMDNYVG